MSRLNDFERSVLDFERILRKDVDEKDRAIRRTFGVSPARYLHFLDVITKKAAALEHDPLLVRRLRRLSTAPHKSQRARLPRSPRDEREA